MASTYAALKTAVSGHLEDIQEAYQAQIDLVAGNIQNIQFSQTVGSRKAFTPFSGSSEGLQETITTATAAIMAAVEAADEAICGEDGEIDELATAHPEE